jgi:hypothetical protein
MVDLEGRMVDPEALCEELFELTAHGVTVGICCNQDIGGEDGVARRELPEMQVVYRLDLFGLHHRRPDRVGRHAFRRALEQHAKSFALEPVAGSEHQRGHNQ